MSRIITGKLRLDVQRSTSPPSSQAAVETVRPRRRRQGHPVQRRARPAAPARSPATRTGSSRCSGTCSPTRSSSRPRAAGCRCCSSGSTRTSRSASSTPARASRPSSCRTCSTGSGRPTPRPPAGTAGWARAGDRQATRRTARRDASGRTSAGRRPGRDVHRRAAADRRSSAERAGTARRGRQHPRPGGHAPRSPRGLPAVCRACGCWSSTTSRTPGRWSGGCWRTAGRSCGRPASAAEALATARGRSGRDVLVSDIGMPGEDGYALIRRVRALEAGREHVPGRRADRLRPGGGPHAGDARRVPDARRQAGRAGRADHDGRQPRGPVGGGGGSAS